MNEKSLKTINLLPWRQQQRKRQARSFLLSILFSLLGTAALIATAQLLITYRHSQQNLTNQFLQHQLDSYTQQVQELQTILEEQRQIGIEQDFISLLQQRRAQTRTLLEKIATILPAQSWLTMIRRNDEVLLLNGQTFVSEQITLLMKNLTAAKWLSQPILTEINHSNDKVMANPLLTFTIKMDLYSKQ